ncbi:Vitamin B12 import ATP-binding protein BtuD [Streptomyces alboniger]
MDEVLGVVGLQDVAKKRSKGFSLGMGQRLGIAAALLGDPQVLLFDEPVNGLDPEGILWVRNLMKTLASEGRTVFVSSHLMSEMALTAEHLIVIGRGQLLADMSVKDFIPPTPPASPGCAPPQTDAAHREKLSAALTEAGGQVLPEQDGALRVTGLPLPRIRPRARRRRTAVGTLPAPGLAGGGVHADDAGRSTTAPPTTSARASRAAAARRPAAGPGARAQPGPARLVRAPAAAAGRSALRDAAAAGPVGYAEPLRDRAAAARLRSRRRTRSRARPDQGRHRQRGRRPMTTPPTPQQQPQAQQAPQQPQFQPQPQPQQAYAPAGAPAVAPPPPPAPAAPAPPSAWQQAMNNAYSSPIPVKKTHLGNALASEWTKIKSVRSTMWTLGVFIVLVIDIGLLAAANAGRRTRRRAVHRIPPSSAWMWARSA